MRRTVAGTVALLLASALVGCGSDDAPRATDWAPAPKNIGGLTVLAQSDGDGFRLHAESGAKTFLPGVNLGSTTPLHQPGEVDTIDAKHYRRWIGDIAGLGAKVVRIYTLLPPAFYAELAAYNRAHPTSPLYLVQGVYLPDESYIEEGRTLYDPAADRAFTEELHDVQRAVHGELTRKPTPGRASGSYNTDVSPWIASWIIGVEWDPAGVVRTDRVKTRYRPGDYFAATDRASPTEQWLAGHMDDLARLEARAGTSVPIAFANWPTADPLDHSTEPLRSEDLVGVDANHVLPTAAWPGGTFASFHAYPYYPDFQRYEPAFARTQWRGAPDRYAGYLAALQSHFAARMPLLVTEFGVPASLGSAHVGTEDSQGRTRDQGGHSERQSMAMNADMMRMMQRRGIGGAFVFAWVDEWFKRTWNTTDHQDPERRQLWHDPLTNEQWFGLVATDPDPIADAAVEDTPADGVFDYRYVWADASYVHIVLRARDTLPDRIRIDADVLPGRKAADYRILVDRSARTARAEVRRELDPIRLDTRSRPYHPDQPVPWHLYRLLINRDYPGHPAEYDEVGNLVRGSWDPQAKSYDSLATWRTTGDKTLELRVPWPMLGLADPSSKVALGEGNPAQMVTIDKVGLTFHADGASSSLDFAWPEWNFTGYRERLKAGSEDVEKAMRDLAP